MVGSSSNVMMRILLMILNSQIAGEAYGYLIKNPKPAFTRRELLLNALDQLPKESIVSAGAYTLTDTIARPNATLADHCLALPQQLYNITMWVATAPDKQTCCGRASQACLSSQFFQSSVQWQVVISKLYLP